MPREMESVPLSVPRPQGLGPAQSLVAHMAAGQQGHPPVASILG